MNKRINLLGQSALSIVSMTIVIIPFMLFIQLSDGVNWVTIIPFALFYIFRMTGIFFIRGVKTSLNSYDLLKISLICGTIGCSFSILGSIYFPMYILGGFFLGISGAWLPPANTGVTIYLKKHDGKQKSSMLLSMVMIIILGITMFLPVQFRYIFCFLFYGLMYACSLYRAYQYSGYKIEPRELEEGRYSYLILFFVFFILLFLLRTSRLMLNSVEFDYFAYGYLFLIFVVILSTFVFRKHFKRKIPRSLSFITIINGALGNYLFLFCSLYTGGYYGKEHIVFKVYIPYVLGMILSAPVEKMLSKRLKNYSLIGTIIGLLTILSTPFFTIGIFCTSLFKSCLNSWLTEQYSDAMFLPSDKRIWVKYTIQNIGSISHQFILMIMASLILTNRGKTIREFYIYSSKAEANSKSMEIMQYWNHIATALILLLIIIYSGINLKTKAKKHFQ